MIEYLKKNDYSIEKEGKKQFIREMNNPFKFVGFMLSRNCHADCIFCPITHNEELQKMQLYMSPQVLNRAVKELSENDYQGKINFGENGDALANPDFKKMFKKVRKDLPSSKMVLFSNMMNMGERKAKTILEQGIFKLTVNFDGATPDTFEASKRGLKFDIVKKNLLTFIRLREEIESDCQIQILIIPPRRFMEMRCNYTNKEVRYDAPEVIGFWRSCLRQTDIIKEIAHFYNWTNYPSSLRTKPCPITSQLFRTFYISVEGDAYLCCLDFKTEMTYGNISKDSMYDLWNSYKRMSIVSAIINKNFEKVGLPCLKCAEKTDYLRSYLNFMKSRIKHKLGRNKNGN